jgi:uncharacterized repeat protein (TIGR03803 family)
MVLVYLFAILMERPGSGPVGFMEGSDGALYGTTQYGGTGLCNGGTIFKLSPPSFSTAVIHPAIVQSPLAAPKPYECPNSAQVFLPNLQASYLRNLSFLI